MASIGESYDIIGVLLENNGVYPGDPQAFALSSYRSNWGGTTFHVAMNERDLISLYSSPFCNNIFRLWTRAYGLTEYGELVLAKYKEQKSND